VHLGKSVVRAWVDASTVGQAVADSTNRTVRTQNVVGFDPYSGTTRCGATHVFGSLAMGDGFTSVRLGAR
jgi:CobQ-like glutamine amidotransferase family enzyme